VRGIAELAHHDVYDLAWETFDRDAAWERSAGANAIFLEMGLDRRILTPPILEYGPGPYADNH
jgi:hypothetical protein